MAVGVADVRVVGVGVDHERDLRQGILLETFRLRPLAQRELLAGEGEEVASRARVPEAAPVLSPELIKQSIALAGVSFPGHTELLAARAGLRTYGTDYAMYFDSPRLRTVLATVHLSLREALDPKTRR